MLPEQAIEISKVRFDHAKECLRDAKLLLAGESYRSAANRAYYAIFHAMRAVLALDGVDMKHHSGIISEFRKRYIKTGVFDASLSGLISELSDVPRAAITTISSSFPRRTPPSRCSRQGRFWRR